MKYQEIYFKCRMALIVLFVIISLFACIKSQAFSWDLDFHIHPPGGEADQLEERHQRKQDDKDYEKYQKKKEEGRKTTPKEDKKARKYERERRKEMVNN